MDFRWSSSIWGGIGGALVGFFEVRGTAYVPTFTAPLLANHSLGFIIAMLVPCLVAFFVTLIVNQIKRAK
ncbi:hypothetical protein [Gracilibacillus sp. JCM 18860]|uniref:hypothetical protein n=1 Tax=Gracilibacillus sp. JCM 18860 TaxID=1306159 RepID=UPI00326127FD